MKQSRRNFLKWTGIFASGSLLPACKAKVEKLIPFLVQPESYIPFKKTEYRSFFYDCLDFAEVVVSNFDNHPVKLEGNPDSSANIGGLNARIQAALFNFYSSKRLKEPLHNKQATSWEKLDEQVITLLKRYQKQKKEVLILLPHIISPSENKAIGKFKKYWSNIVILNLSPVNYSHLAMANQKLTGNFCVPTYAIDKAKCVLSFQCDFLESWLNGLKNTNQYSKAKKLYGKKFIHLQYESILTITGSNATKRIPATTEETKDLIIGLHARSFKNNYQVKFEENKTRIDEILNLLENNLQQNLLLYGGEDELIHQLVLELSKHYNNFGNTVFPGRPDLLHSISIPENQHQILLSCNPELIIFYKTNPFYYWTRDEELAKKVRSIPNRIGIFDSENETSVECTIVASSHHHFETWSDAQVDNETFCLGQPVFNSIFNTRTSGENFLRWSANNELWRDFLKKNWYENIIPLVSNQIDNAWQKVKQKGKIQLQHKIKDMSSAFLPGVKYPEIEKEVGWKLQFFYDAKMGTGENRNNKYLHELADPVSKVCWDNYFTLHPDDLKQFAWNKEENIYPVIEVYFNRTFIKAPAFPVINQTKNTIGFALGYGTMDKEPIGINAYPLIFSENNWKKNWKVEQIKLTGEIAELGVIHKTTNLPAHYLTEISLNDILKKSDELSKFEKWLMLIDLDVCTGCSSCVVACRVENNIPLVGKNEILKNRDIDWMKIERYELDNGQILHLPLMCQHCDNAPCESVCPVLATTHSSDGLNQMVYNRCVGTRYCAVNCVYNVRRFNWFNYRRPPFQELNPIDTKFGNLILNPRVTLRTKGIMEKCNFCQHRIQEEREKAKLEGRKMIMNNAAPACSSSCPAKAIQFIDLNSKEGIQLVSNEDKRMFHLHAKYNTEPSVIYLSNRL